MLLGICLEVLPQMVAQRVLGAYSTMLVGIGIVLRFAAVFRMQHGLKPWPHRRLGNRDIGQVKTSVFGETRHENAFSMLRNEPLGVDHAIGDVVAEFILQGSADDLERAPSVVTDQILHVLQQEGAWPALLDDAHDVEKQRALGLARETMLLAQGVLLGHAGDGEWLAREACRQQVVLRHVFGVDVPNVALERVPVNSQVVVGAVRLPRELVPLGRENALASRRLEAPAHATDTRKQVDEAQFRIRSAASTATPGWAM